MINKRGDVLESDKYFKELTENMIQVRLDIRELTTEVRSLKDLQKTVNDHQVSIKTLEKSDKAAHKRLDKIDKIHFWVTTLVLGAVILMVLASSWEGGG